MEATSDTSSEVTAQTDTVVRPVRDVDAEALGRVHAKCWHETYDHLISKAALENVSPKRLAELWTHWVSQGPDFKMFAALADLDVDIDPAAAPQSILTQVSEKPARGAGVKITDEGDAGEKLAAYLIENRLA